MDAVHPAGDLRQPLQFVVGAVEQPWHIEMLLEVGNRSGMVEMRMCVDQGVNNPIHTLVHLSPDGRIRPDAITAHDPFDDPVSLLPPSMMIVAPSEGFVTTEQRICRGPTMKCSMIMFTPPRWSR